jgi:hypothetical protein
VPPYGGHIGGEDPVVVLLERRVLVLDVAPELRVGGVQDRQALQTREDLDAFTVVGDLRRARLLALADERVLDLVGADGPGVGVGGLNALPGVLLDADTRRGDGLAAVDEVPRQQDAECLGRLDAVLFREGEHGVLGGVGRQDMGVGPRVVDLVQIAAERDGDVEVLDVMGVAVPRDLDDAVLRLAVLVLAENRGHGVSSLGTRSSRTG